MTTATIGQPTALLAQFYDYEGGSLVDLDALPTITVASIASGAVTVAATSSGVTHPGTGSYGYAWTPASGLAPGDYLVQWTGARSSAPTTATETVTLVGAAPSAAGVQVWYATREDVKDALDAKETARSNSKIDRAVGAASAALEGLCHRVFYPVRASRSWDWPNGQTARAWRLWLDDNEVISVSALTSGGRLIDGTDYFLRRSDGREEPPFTHIELDTSRNAAFGGGPTTQRDITVTGWFGYRDDTTTVGTHTGISAGATTLTVDGTASAEVGIGSLLRLDDERVIVTARSMVDTGQALAAGVDAQMRSTVLTVADGSGFAEGETVMVDGERFRVEEVAGNSLIVRRAWDGSTAAAHTSGAAVWAPRSLRVRRAACGTSTISHGAGDVARWDAPALVRELCIAQAVTNLLQESAGYARTVGTGEGTREAAGRGLAAIRDDALTAHGRKARSRAV